MAIEKHGFCLLGLVYEELARGYRIRVESVFSDLEEAVKWTKKGRIIDFRRFEHDYHACRCLVPIQYGQSIDCHLCWSFFPFYHQFIDSPYLESYLYLMYEVLSKYRNKKYKLSEIGMIWWQGRSKNNPAHSFTYKGNSFSTSYTNVYDSNKEFKEIFLEQEFSFPELRKSISAK